MLKLILYLFIGKNELWFTILKSTITVVNKETQVEVERTSAQREFLRSGLFGSVVVVVFLSIFYVEMH